VRDLRRKSVSQNSVEQSIEYLMGNKSVGRFKFSSDEQRILREILRRFDNGKVDRFLFQVSIYTYFYIYFKSNSFPKDDIEKHFLPDLRQCAKTLEQIITGNIDLTPQINFDAWIDRNVADEIRSGKIPGLLALEPAEKAYPYIKKLEKLFKEILDKSKRQRGQRSRADQVGFVRELARLYKINLGKQPSKWRGGTFNNFVSCLFDILFPKDGINHDVSRSIRSAVEAINVQDAL